MVLVGPGEEGFVGLVDGEPGRVDGTVLPGGGPSVVGMLGSVGDVPLGDVVLPGMVDDGEPGNVPGVDPGAVPGVVWPGVVLPGMVLPGMVLPGVPCCCAQAKLAPSSTAPASVICRAVRIIILVPPDCRSRALTLCKMRMPRACGKCAFMP